MSKRKQALAAIPKLAFKSAASPEVSRNLSHGKCPDVNESYEKLNRIGEGTYGTVYRARDKATDRIVALKRCILHHEASDGFPLTSVREISILRLLSGHHPGIVKLLDVVVSASRSGVFLVFEYCEHDLGQLIDSYFAMHGRSPFRESQVKQLGLQLLSALSFLHSRHIIHRDLKLSNLLYNHRGELRLADFGLARRTTLHKTTSGAFETEKGSQMTPKVVSLWYRPPEILFGESIYDESVDNWGAGLVIAELCLGEPLLKGSSELNQIQKIISMFGIPPAGIFPGIDDSKFGKYTDSSSVNEDMSSYRNDCTYAFMCKFEAVVHSSSINGLIKFLLGFLRYDFKQRVSSSEGLKSTYFTDHPLPLSPRLMPTFPTRH